MQTRIIVNGANGKMGQIACKTLEQQQDFHVVAKLGRGDSLQKAIATYKAEIVVDLTRADSVFTHAKIIVEEGAHPVIGTSGLTDENIQYLSHQCYTRKLGGLIVPNFSIAAVLMMRFAADAARFIQDVEIVEMHHEQKYDSPSGTAIKTAEVIADGRQQASFLTEQRNEPLQMARGAPYRNIPIHSVRLPGVLARQSVIFGQQGETLTITHDSIDRISFMPGLLLACRKVGSLHSLHYGLETLLF